MRVFHVENRACPRFCPGPLDGMNRDIFEKVTRDRIANALFVDIWNEYHVLVGEVHCASLVRREVLGVDWWTSQP